MEDVKQIILSSSIDEMSIDPIINDLITHRDEYKKIALFINSPGGDVTNGQILIDNLKYLGKKVITINIGQCCSMAFYLYVIGKKRYCFPNSKFMFHEMFYDSGQEYKLNIIKKDIDESNKQQEEYIKLVTSKTYIKKKDLKNYIKNNKDMWFDAHEAIKHGIVDQIVFSYKELDELIKSA